MILNGRSARGRRRQARRLRTRTRTETPGEALEDGDAEALEDDGDAGEALEDDHLPQFGLEA